MRHGRSNKDEKKNKNANHQARSPIELTIISENETLNHIDVINEKRNSNIMNTEEPHQMNQVIIISDNDDDKATINSSIIKRKNYKGKGGTHKNTESVRKAEISNTVTKKNTTTDKKQRQRYISRTSKNDGHRGTERYEKNR